MPTNELYSGNPLLKRANIKIEFTEENITEYIKCGKDPVYFAKNYVKIVSLDEGLVPFKLYKFQEKLIKNFHQHRFNICKMPRQCGKSSTTIAYLMHYIIFNSDANVALLANKAQTAKDLLGRLQLAYENLPKWLQHGVKIWNKASLELDNGSKIIASSTSGSAIRGGSYNIIFLDEFAFIPNQIADEFFSSVYPTITSGKSTKVIMVSTPKGMNSFYKFWMDAIRGKNEYVPTEVHWSEVPGRDAKWKQQTIANTSQEQWEQEFECSFLGSVDTLISSSKLQCLVYNDPIMKSEGLDVYENPKEEHNYMITVDVSEGTGNDYHAFVVIDITEIPYKIVAKYRNNELKPMLLPDIIYKVANSYNKAYVLIEIASVGEQVAKDLMFDLEYENMLMCSMRGRAGQLVGQGFSGKTSQMGIKMSKQVKRVGCSNLKTIIEDDKLIINDFDIISELTTFVSKNNSFEGEVGTNDDLSMCIHRDAKITTEDGIKTMKWIVDNQYTGKVLSIDNNNNFVWSKVIGHSSKSNLNKKWIGIRGKSRNTLICTTDHKVAYIDNILNPEIKYIEAENMLGKYNVILPGKRFHKTNPLFNKEQISALVGTLLGDASISKSGQLICCHGASQKDYLEHKNHLFNSNLRITHKNGREQYWGDGKTNEHTRYFRELFYPKGKKIVKNALELVDEISLAYWYMDDGSRRDNFVLLCTDCFSYEEHELIVNMFKNKFNIEVKITKIHNVNPKTKEKNEAFRITINSTESQKFFEVISPYIIPSMRYKIPEKYHHIEVKKLSNKFLDFGSEKITRIVDRSIKGFESRLYDISVEHTHNFIANGMVVHNCLVVFSWLIVQDYFKEMTNNDIRKRIYEEQKDQIEQDMSPFGFINDGMMSEDKEFIEKTTGDYWILADENNKKPMEVWNLDEYGDVSTEFDYMWNYM